MYFKLVLMIALFMQSNRAQLISLLKLKAINDTSIGNGSRDFQLPVFIPKYIDADSDEESEYDIDTIMTNANISDISTPNKNMEAIFDFVQFFLEPTNSYENTIENAKNSIELQLENE